MVQAVSALYLYRVLQGPLGRAGGRGEGGGDRMGDTRTDMGGGGAHGTEAGQHGTRDWIVNSSKVQGRTDMKM